MRSRHRPNAPDRVRHFCILAALLTGVAAFAGAVPVPQPRPVTAKPAPSADGVTDMSRAVPMKSLLKLPSTPEQFRSLAGEIARKKPQLESAQSKSEALARQAALLQRQLIETAARVGALETEKLQLDAEVIQLAAEDARLTASFSRDRVSVSRLLAVLERLQHDMPPAMTVRPDDALAAARGAMLIGASLPGVYHEASGLARRIASLRHTRLALLQRRAETARNAVRLSQARIDLDRLLATKRLEAGAAAARYGDLKGRLDTITAQAGSLQALLQKVAQLGSAPMSQSVITVNAANGAGSKLSRGSLLQPVAGAQRPGGVDGVGGNTAPGLTYLTLPGARVIAPADGKVVFAGKYPKVGLVLILEMPDGYHLVLAGLDHFDVRLADSVLAGEPVGSMPKFDHEPRLYFELRQKNGRGMSPAPYLDVVLRKAKS
jgi:murein hydrolase activator